MYFRTSVVNNLTLWLLFMAGLGALALLLPKDLFNSASKQFILLIGAVGIWRYSIGITHFLRGIWFAKYAFPKIRKKTEAKGYAAYPPHIYLMVTSFRIDTNTTAQVYNSVFREAYTSNTPCTVVASIVEVCDEQLIRTLFNYEHNAHPNNTYPVQLKIVRIPGTGKRDGLAHGFKAISRDMPDNDAVVAVIDGDTVLEPGCVAKTAPLFNVMPSVGALTTNEFCEVKGSYIISQWHKLRFGQRHINMCSMALSKRVLTLTGRMSMFRAEVVTNPEFIQDVQFDNIHHWRLGRFRFLTGDDKSSWYSLMKLGWDTYYVPDAVVTTVEHPPNPSFFKASKQLMFRWYGNNLRQNSRAVKLGPKRLGWFCYYVINDQRISMWTSLLGLSMAIVATLKYSALYLVAYFLWILITRTLISLSLLAGGHNIGPTFPLLLYYNQILGALMKIYVFFRLDRQSWTRQPTKLKRDLQSYQRFFNKWSSRVVTFSCASIFAAIVFTVV